MNIGDLTITSLDTITAFGVTSGEYMYTLDELQNTTIAQTEEKTDITGRGGRKLSSLKKNKGITISGTNGLISCGLLETQTGGEFETKNTDVMWVDYLTVTTTPDIEADKTGLYDAQDGSCTATTKYKATGLTGAEIEALYVKNNDGTLGEAYTQNTSESVAEGTKYFSYDPSTRTISFYKTALTDGTEIVVYYKRTINASVLENKSDTYSGKAQLYIDATAEDRCANIYHVQFYIPKADFNGEFSLEMGSDQAAHAFEAESLAGGCSANAGSNLWTYTVFGENAEDAS